MSSRHESIRSPHAEINPPAEDDLASLVVVLHGPPAFYARSTAIRPVDRREMVSHLPELALDRRETAAPRGAVHGAPNHRLAGRTLRQYLRAEARCRVAEARFAQAASFPGRGTESGFTRFADRLGARFDRQLDRLTDATARAIRALEALGCSPGRGAARVDGRIFALYLDPDVVRLRIVVVEMDQVVEVA